MQKQEVQTSIIIEPQYFHTEKMYDYILKCVKEKELTCTKTYGYIDHIYQILNIYNQTLLDSGECRIDVVFEADCFKPTIGSKIQTTVEMVFPHGIFSSLYVLRFLVPFKCLEENYVYIPSTGYKHKKTLQIITIGSIINIVITNLKYDKGHFSCIADLDDTL
jgi:DNA-directed RNA polymerase subunit E'/Rpb7